MKSVSDKSLLRTLRNLVKRCPVCQTERVQASLCDVPAVLIEKAKTTELLTEIEIDYYFFCPTCGNYSVVYCAYGAGDWNELNEVV